MKFTNYFINMYRQPTAVEIAVKDLEDARRSLLAAQASAEYEAKMVEYYQGVVARLSQYVNGQTTAKVVTKSEYD